MIRGSLRKLILITIMTSSVFACMPLSYAKADTETDNQVVTEQVTNNSGWVKSDDNWKYFDSNGTLLTGWIRCKNDWYYSNENGVRVEGWITSNNKRYYLKDNGVMATGFNKIGDKNYFFDLNSGELRSGWIKLYDKWHYLNSDGSEGIGWITDGTNKYYLGEDGIMKTGWITVDENEYYLKSDGSMAKGWTGIGKDIFYLDPQTGVKLKNTQINGYQLDENGKLNLGKSEVDIDKDFLDKNITIDTDECEYKSKNDGIEETIFKGIDISNHNGNVDFNQVRDSGVRAVYMKATESNWFLDQYLSSNYANAKSAGLKVGFYHFLVGTSSPEEQAQFFYNNIKDKESDLKPCVDVETSSDTALDYTARFIKEFQRLSNNMDICVYTYTNFISNFDGRLSGYSLWEANYNNTPFSLPSNNVWSTKAGHQYSSTGSIAGVDGNVDLDVFNHDILLKK